MLMQADAATMALAEEVIATGGLGYTPAQVMEIPAIIGAKNRYFWCIDHRLTHMMEDVFTPDGFRAFWQGRLGYTDPKLQAAQNSNSCGADMLPQHFGWNHMVQFLGEGRARLLTKLHDFHTYRDDGSEYRGYGFYVDDLVKCPDGRWRIETLRLSYHRVDGKIRNL